MPELAENLISNASFISELISNLDSLKTITSNKKETFYNVAAGFDIETSSFYDKNDLKTAIMYEWTFGIGWERDNELKAIVTYGRTWRQLETLLDAVSVIMDLGKSKRLVVYVHNLPYEWQFIRKRFSWSKVFYLDERKPVYAITDNGIEFRCSLKLSGKSLANTAKDLVKYKAMKMEGDLDYSLIRHPETPLTPTELGYCYADVQVLLCYIQEKIEQEGDITRIPLTKTGYVRRYCKNAMFPEGSVQNEQDSYADLDFETAGVSPAERSISRRIYPRKCSPSRDDPYQSWFIRLYEFLSREHGRVQIPDECRSIHW